MTLEELFNHRHET